MDVDGIKQLVESNKSLEFSQTRLKDRISFLEEQLEDKEKKLSSAEMAYNVLNGQYQAIKDEEFGVDKFYNVIAALDSQCDNIRLKIKEPHGCFIWVYGNVEVNTEISCSTETWESQGLYFDEVAKRLIRTWLHVYHIFLLSPKQK